MEKSKRPGLQSVSQSDLERGQGERNSLITTSAPSPDPLSASFVPPLHSPSNERAQARVNNEHRGVKTTDRRRSM